jgi:Icc-related predicted phosphoesterase
MKIQILSDLHFEAQGSPASFIKPLKSDGIDVLILAGDIIPIIKVNSLDIIKMFTDKYKHVIHVPGNHEYYSSSFMTCNLIMHDWQLNIPNYYFFNKSVVEIEGVKFAGATNWFPKTPNAELLSVQINDFNAIYNLSHWVYEENDNASMFWQTHAVGADVWISHHAPSNWSVSDKYKGHPLNCFFVDHDLGEVILNQQPKFHIHGHMHNSSDYMIGDTRVICNPYGYEGYSRSFINPEFNANFVVELD